MGNSQPLTWVDRLRRMLPALVSTILLLPVPALATVTWSSAWTGILDNSSVQTTLSTTRSDYTVTDGATVSFLRLNFSASDYKVNANDTTTIVFAREFSVAGSPSSIFTQMQSTFTLDAGSTLKVSVVVSPQITPELTYNATGPNMFSALTTGSHVTAPLGTGSVTWTLTFTSTTTATPVLSSATPFSLTINGI